jgi:hypothetical protein
MCRAGLRAWGAGLGLELLQEIASCRTGIGIDRVVSFADYVIGLSLILGSPLVCVE